MNHLKHNLDIKQWRAKHITSFLVNLTVNQLDEILRCALTSLLGSATCHMSRCGCVSRYWSRATLSECYISRSQGEAFKSTLKIEFFIDLNAAITNWLSTCTRPDSCWGRIRNVGKAPRRSWCRARPRRRAPARAAGAGRTTPSSCSPSCGSAEEQIMRQTLSVLTAPCAPGWRCRCPGWRGPRAGPSSPRCCGQRSRRSCSRWSPSPPCRYVNVKCIYILNDIFQ